MYSPHYSLPLGVDYGKLQDTDFPYVEPLTKEWGQIQSCLNRTGRLPTTLRRYSRRYSSWLYLILHLDDRATVCILATWKTMNLELSRAPRQNACLGISKWERCSRWGPLEASRSKGNRRNRSQGPAKRIEETKSPSVPRYFPAVHILNDCIALKNAHDLLHDVMKAVDSNGDGKIQYQGMRSANMELDKNWHVWHQSSGPL